MTAAAPLRQTLHVDKHIAVVVVDFRKHFISS
jgi:hypothetical protein